jgi:serine/threonine-protein kinase
MIIKGQKIDGRYQIIRTIGEGGMANVYLAYDTILDREVAVKILRGDLAGDEKFVKRFQREAKAASSLNHPNIVEMYDVGEDDGNYFLVMEFVDGRTLKSLVKKRGALSLTEVIDIMLQLTSGIAHAHDSYLIHRDLKPQNVLMLEDGRAKITDFGIAVALNSTELTQTNSVMGSVHYLPPEQANGGGASVKSDIYSLGILMYELLIGKLPFKGENAVEIAIKHMKEPIPSVRSQNESIPQSIENIILKACAKNPKNRYDSVNEMHEDLKNALNEDQVNQSRLVYRYSENELEETKVLPNVSDIVEEKGEQSVEKKTRKKGKKLTIAVVVAIMFCLLVAISTVVGAYLVLEGIKHEDVALPAIAGESLDSVEQELNDLGLYVEIVEVYSDDIAEGYVVDYNSKREGNNVKEGVTVKIEVSKGPSGFILEDYRGKKIDVVKLELESKGIKVVATSKNVSTEQEDYEDAFEGKILEQSKEAGTRLKEGNVIELTYATLVTVYPDFTDGTYKVKKIQEFCDDNGITCVFEYVETVDHPDGTILTQSRAKDVEVKKGVTLRIEVAKTPAVEDPFINE